LAEKDGKASFAQVGSPVPFAPFGDIPAEFDGVLEADMRPLEPD